MISIKQELRVIKERNQRVEADKAWETSWARALSIAAFTYATAGIWLLVIDDESPWLKAFVPSIGYLLSTFSLSFIQRVWTRYK